MARWQIGEIWWTSGNRSFFYVFIIVSIVCDLLFAICPHYYSHVNILLLLFYLFYVYNFFLLYCYYYSVIYVTVMPVSAYMALAFVFGFIQIN